LAAADQHELQVGASSNPRRRLWQGHRGAGLTCVPNKCAVRWGLIGRSLACGSPRTHSLIKSGPPLGNVEARGHVRGWASHFATSASTPLRRDQLAGRRRVLGRSLCGAPHARAGWTERRQGGLALPANLARSIAMDDARPLGQSRELAADAGTAISAAFEPFLLLRRRHAQPLATVCLQRRGVSLHAHHTCEIGATPGTPTPIPRYLESGEVLLLIRIFFLPLLFDW